MNRLVVGEVISTPNSSEGWLLRYLIIIVNELIIRLHYLIPVVIGQE